MSASATKATLLDMYNSSGKTAIFVFWLLFWAAVTLAVEAETAESISPSSKAAIIICKGDIDNGLYRSIVRRTNMAIEQGCEYLIYEIDTYGGDLFSADNISDYFLLEVNDRAHTVAYVSKKAISAGSMISVACEDIIMKNKTKIGDCAPIQPGVKLEGVEREKVETFTRAAFVNSAQANGYPETLLRAMVTMQIEVYRVKNLQTGEYEFFESERLPKDPNSYDLDGQELIVKNDELLTLTASEAYEYGISRTLVDDVAGALDFLSERDGVVFSEQSIVLRTNWSEEMVRWINSPAIMSVLIMLALLGVYIELNSPGVGLPGLVAVICFAIILGSKYLYGLANWVEVTMFGIGVLLLLVEILLIPGFGIVGFLGIVCIVLGVFGMLLKNPPDKVPWPQTEFDMQLITNGLLGLVLGLAGFAVLVWLFAKYLPKIPLLGRLMLRPAALKPAGPMPISMTAPPEGKTAGPKVGDMGVVSSKLRPTGKAKIGDAIVEVVAEGEFLDIGTEVMIIAIKGNNVVVRKTGNQPEG